MPSPLTRPPVNRPSADTLGVPAVSGPRSWVQTERRAHEAWARLAVTNPRAAALLHTLIARMGDRNAVVISRATLAQLMGASEATVKRAVADLRAARWIDTVQLGGKGGINAYLVNSQVAWGQPRDQLHLATFTATVVANAQDQPPDYLEHRELRRIPVVFPGEAQLPTGPGEDPPSQPPLGGLEPDLPALCAPDVAERAELEAAGQQRLLAD